MPPVNGTEVLSAGRDIAGHAASFGAETFVLFLFLLVTSAFAGLWLWKVVIPSERSRRQCMEAMSASVAASTTILKAMQDQIQVSGKSIAAIEGTLGHLVHCVDSGTIVAERVADRVGVDVKAELGQIRGIALAARRGEKPT